MKKQSISLCVIFGRESGKQVKHRKKGKPPENSTKCSVNPLYHREKKGSDMHICSK